MEKVCIKSCMTYEVQRIKEQMLSALETLGGLDAYVARGEKVLLKVNLLMKKRPEEATTTHPNFVEALSLILLEHGCDVIVGDSPGGPYTLNALHGIYKVCGYADIAERIPIRLNENVGTAEQVNNDNKLLKRLTVIDVMTKVDKVISVSKLKTHGMMTFTGAVKNMFGTIPGLIKAEYHFKMPEIKDFSEMLVDVCQNAAPVLAFMDGIVGMEGAGPSAGDPRDVGFILVSKNPYALDLVATDLIGIPAENVPTVARSIERGLCPDSVEKLDLCGVDLERARITDFSVPKVGNADFLNRMPAPVRILGNKLLKPRPHFNLQVCIGCGECSRCCPPSAIEMTNKLPKLNLEKCIRCYCCQELCPVKAVKIHKPFLNKILFKK